MRTIYWRVRSVRGSYVYGEFTDLFTLRGATRRLWRTYPTWAEVEAQFTPFE